MVYSHDDRGTDSCVTVGNHQAEILTLGQVESGTISSDIPNVLRSGGDGDVREETRVGRRGSLGRGRCGSGRCGVTELNVPD